MLQRLLTVYVMSLHNVVIRLRSGSYIFREQSGGAVQFRGARLWAGLQPEQEHAGGCGLQPGSGQEEGETDGGERRISPGGGVVGASDGQVRTRGSF